MRSDLGTGTSMGQPTCADSFPFSRECCVVALGRPHCPKSEYPLAGVFDRRREAGSAVRVGCCRPFGGSSPLPRRWLQLSGRRKAANQQTPCALAETPASPSVDTSPGRELASAYSHLKTSASDNDSALENGLSAQNLTLSIPES